jgi:hypothetical protein
MLSLLICVGNIAESRCETAVHGSSTVSGSPEIAIFPVKFPVWRRQPASLAFGQTSEETRERAGNRGFSRIRFRLQAPGLPKLREKSPKVSGQIRKYSRFAETVCGDRFDHHCRPTVVATRVASSSDDSDDTSARPSRRRGGGGGGRHYHRGGGGPGGLFGGMMRPLFGR